jgi:AcrR family transcriptional regulator
MAHDDTRARLLEAAGEVFSEKGYEGATVREIKDRAHANIAAVNYHFGDKERLYIETVKAASQCQSQSHPLPDWPPGTRAEDKLRDFISTMVHRHLDERSPWKRRIMLRELAQPSPACAALVHEQIRPMAELLGQIVEELLPDATPAKRRLCAFSIVGQCLHYTLARPIIAELVGPEEFRTFDADHLAEHITEFSLAALRAGRKKARAVAGRG